MRKWIVSGLTAVLGLLALAPCAILSLLACSSMLPDFPPDPTPEKVVDRHISNLTLHADSLYFGAGYCLYRLNVQSQMADKIVCARDWTFQRPAVDGKRAYVQVMLSPGSGQFLAAIELSTGAIAWRADESRARREYFRDMKDYTFLVDNEVITAQEEITERGPRICAFDPQSGRRLWRSEPDYFGVRAVPFVIHDHLIWHAVGGEKGDPKKGTLVALNLSDGKTKQTLNLKPRAAFSELLYVDDKWALGLDYDQSVWAVDLARPNEVAWRTERLSTLSMDTDQATLYSDLFIVPMTRAIYALNANTGQVEWAFDPEARGDLARDVSNMVLFVWGEKPVLYALDAMSGKMIWRYELASYGILGTLPPGYLAHYQTPRPIIDKNIVYIGNKDSIDALDLNTGKLLWKVSIDSAYEYYRASNY